MFFLDSRFYLSVFGVLRFNFNVIQDLAQAGATKRPTCCVLVMLKPAKGDLSAEELEKLKTDYEQVSDDIKELATSVIWLEIRIKDYHTSMCFCSVVPWLLMNMMRLKASKLLSSSPVQFCGQFMVL